MGRYIDVDKLHIDIVWTNFHSEADKEEVLRLIHRQDLVYMDEDRFLAIHQPKFS